MKIQAQNEQSPNHDYEDGHKKKYVKQFNRLGIENVEVYTSPIKECKLVINKIACQNNCVTSQLPADFTIVQLMDVEVQKRPEHQNKSFQFFLAFQNQKIQREAETLTGIRYF